MKKYLLGLDNDDGTGLDLSYYPKYKVIRISGWYDDFMEIPGREVGLKDFLVDLGITLEDCKEVLQDEDNPIVGKRGKVKRKYNVKVVNKDESNK